MGERASRPLALLIAGLLSAILARVLILSMIDVTSFWVFTGGYQAPSHALLLIACVLIAHDASRETRARCGEAIRARGSNRRQVS